MSEFEDMSPWAVHFTRPRRLQPLPDVSDPLERGLTHQELAEAMAYRNEETTPGYNGIMSILWDKEIEPFEEPHGAGKDVPEVAERHRSAAFSEIPLHLLDRLVRGRSEFGIGFTQEFLLSHGGGRVWYLEADGAPAAAIRGQIAERQADGVDPGDRFWETTPFIDFPEPDALFADWRWEREWRVPHGLRFTPDDVAFLFIPERFHQDARDFFVGHQVANTGPAYLCPYIDVTWDRERIRTQLNRVVATTT